MILPPFAPMPAAMAARTTTPTAWPVAEVSLSTSSYRCVSNLAALIILSTNRFIALFAKPYTPSLRLSRQISQQLLLASKDLAPPQRKGEAELPSGMFNGIMKRFLRPRRLFFEELSARIESNTVESHLIMEVRIGAFSRAANVGNPLVLPNSLTFYNVNLG